MARAKTPPSKPDVAPPDTLTVKALEALRRREGALSAKTRAAVDAIVASAPKGAAKAVTAAKALAKTLGDADERIAVWDHVAAAVFEHGGRARANAATCHAAARADERKRKGAVDLDEAALVAEALARGGAVWVKELTHLAKAARAAKRLDLAAQITRAAVETVRHGEAPSDDLLGALAALGQTHAVTALAAWIVDATSRAAIDDDLWRAATPVLGATLDAHPEALAAVIDLPPTRHRTPGWLLALAAAKVGARVAATAPDAACALVDRCLAVGEPSAADPLVLASLEATLAPLVASMRARGETVSAIEPAGFDNRARFHVPELTELLLALDAPLSFDRCEHATFELYAWSSAPLELPYQRLERIAEHPVYGPRLGLSLERSLDNTGLASAAAKVAAIPAAVAALEHLADRIVAHLVEVGTLGAFVALRTSLGALCQPAVLAACPRIGEAVRRLDAAKMLQQQLRGGLMDEWGWEAFDEAADRLGAGFSLAQSVFPHLALSKGDRLVIAGPEGVVLDRVDPVLAEDFKWLRAAVFVDGDALCVAGDYKAGWLVAGENVTDVKLPYAALVDLMDRGGIMTLDGHPVRRADTSVAPTTLAYNPHFDGVALHVKLGDRQARFEPVTGRALADGEPAWTASREGRISSSFLMAVPPRAARSPLGARDGIGGFVSWCAPYEPDHAEGIDGRAFALPMGYGWYALDGLITFPEREGFHPVSRQLGASWVTLPDGRTPLVATDGEPSSAFWSGGPARLGILWWHLYNARDREGSRALAACSYEAAASMLAAARAAPAASSAPDATELTGYAGLRVTVARASGDAPPLSPALVEAVRDELPAVTHPRLLAGVVRMAALAAEVDAQVSDLVRRVEAASGAAQSSLTNDKVRRLERFFEASFSLPGRWGQDRLGQQIIDAAGFLFDAPTPATERPLERSLPPCFVAWERTLAHGAALFPWLLGAAIGSPARDEARAFLTLWRATPFARVARDRCRVATFAFDAAPFADLHHDRPARLVAWESRYLLRWRTHTRAPMVFDAIEVTPDGAFRAPPGATLLASATVDHNADAARIDAAFALLDAGLSAPFDRASSEGFARETGVLHDAAAVIVTGAWLDALDRDARAVLGTTVRGVAYIDEELRDVRLHGLVAAAVPRDLAELREPARPGADGLTFAQRLARAWNLSPGPRAPVSTELVERLEDDLRNPHPPFLRAARALAAPASVASLTVSKPWVHRPFHAYTANALRFGSVPAGWPAHHDAIDGGWAPRWPDPSACFSYDALAGYAKYVAWVQLELPVGDPLREGAAHVAALLDAGLDDAGHLLPVAMGAIVDRAAFDAFVASLDGAPYAAGDGGASAAGVERDGVVIVWPTPDDTRDGCFVSLRTASLTTPEARARALGLLGCHNGATVALPGVAGETFPYLARFVAWRADGMRALVASLRAPTTPDGSFAADPRASAPDAVARARELHGLDEDGATLWLQLRALAEPTLARVRRYNRWTRARYDAAAATLVAKGLAVAASHKGTARAHWLPGDVAFFDRYPAPVERAKLAAYGLVEGAVPPLDVPLPVAPLATLFSSI